MCIHIYINIWPPYIGLAGGVSGHADQPFYDRTRAPMHRQMVALL